MIGSGIFATPQQIATQVGPYGFTAIIAVWVFCGLLSLAGALTYAELGSMLPRAGGQYVFLREAYGPVWGFLYGWMEFWVARPGSVAAIAVVFARYFNVLTGFDRGMRALHHEGGNMLALFVGAHAEALIAIVLILVLSGVNLVGVHWGGAVQVVFTTLKVAALVGIVLVGFTSPEHDFSRWSWPARSPDAGLLVPFAGAMIASLWAYDGWANGAVVSEEMRNPQRDVPRALILGTLVVMVIYVSVNLAYHLLLPVEAVEATKTVAAAAMQRALGPSGALVIAAAAMISTFGATNGTLLTGPRIFFAMARDRLFFRQMGALHVRFRTPHAAIVVQAIWSVLLIAAAAVWERFDAKGDPLYDQLFTYVIFASWVFYGMSAAAVFVLRRKRPDAQRPYRVLGYPVVPAFFVLVAIGFLANTLVEKRVQALIGLGIVAMGLPAYQAWNRSARAAEEAGE